MATIPDRFRRYSKVTPELEALVREQVRLRRQMVSWDRLADSFGISRRNLFYHIKRIERETRSPQLSIPRAVVRR